MKKTKKLGVFERLHLLNIIPKKGNILEAKIIRGLIEKIEFTSDEIEKYQIVEKQGKVNWDMTMDTTRDIVISDAEEDIIKKAFKEIDTKKEMSLGLLKVYEKFE